MMIKPLSIKELYRQVQKTLVSQYEKVVVTCEISSITQSYTGHLYYTLGNGEQSITAIIFKSDLMRMPHVKSFREGEKVIITGSLNLYEKGGRLSLIVKTIAKMGLGDLKAQIEKLKKKLESEGLFSPLKKREIPSLPQSIGLITSPHGNAVFDFLKVFKKVPFLGAIKFYPCVVQGKWAVASVQEALKKADNAAHDVLILTRGGGSAEDLMVFNEETLVRFIGQLQTPLVSAIGHEKDISLCDYVADKTVATPTAAAHLFAEKTELLQQQLKHFRHRLIEGGHLVQRQKNKVKKLEYAQLLHHIQEKVKKSQHLQRDFLAHLVQKQRDLGYLKKVGGEKLKRLPFLTQARYEKIKLKLENLRLKLNRLSVNETLQQGFAFLKFQDKIITRRRDLQKLGDGQEVTLTFHDGDATLKTFFEESK